MTNRREKFIVLDVEGMQTCRPYNVGFIVADRYGTIYEKHSFAFPAAIWENLQNCFINQAAQLMTHRNIEEILQDMDKPEKDRKYTISTIYDFCVLFIRILKKYHIHRIFAFNVTFDKGAMARLFGKNLFCKICKHFDLEFCDIISGILYTKLLTKKYINYCFTYGYLTPKGFPSYKAEVVYRYLTDDENFTEAHTGLEDVLIEYQILLTSFKAHKPLNFEPCQAWRILRDFCEQNNLSAA